MAQFELTCESTADMTPEFFEKNNIPYVCFHFLINGKEHLDDLGQSMPFEMFYARIAAGSQPTTSAVNTGEFVEFFESILNRGKDILHLSFSSGLSSTYDSALEAREMIAAKYPTRKIIIIDSLAASSGYGLLVTEACTLRDENISIEDTAAWIENNKLNFHHWFFSTDLTSYVRGGRISAASGAIGTVLNICPLLSMDANGKLIPRAKCHGKKRAIKEIVERMKAHAENGLAYSGRCYISQSASMEDAASVAELVEKTFPHLDGKVLINYVGTVIGSHTGPGTVALFFKGDRRI
ncbi:MAG: DegV family protein [Coriobacteriia bacterium]|nr:DegV family protein [Coriobacteriia bacterium]